MAAFGLLVIGDEILSGRREDRHFPTVRRLLVDRGLRLAWVSYLGDDRARLTEALRRSFAAADIVFSTGGIGATPDDHTRQAAAAALGVPLALHPEAATLIEARTREVNLPLTPERLRMGELPVGATLIPNPVNRIPGFSLGEHHFVPGFPTMATPMIEWVLDTHYQAFFTDEAWLERSVIIFGAMEATLTPLMEAIEREHVGVKVFSLPSVDHPQFGRHIELGVKGAPGQVTAAYAALLEGLKPFDVKLGPELVHP